MKSDSRFAGLNTRVFKLFKNAAGEDFVATGFLLSSQFMLTCNHVKYQGGCWILDAGSGDYQELEYVAQDGNLDVALLRLPSSFGSRDVQAIPLARSVPWTKSQFPSDACCLFGGSEMTQTEGLTIISTAPSSNKGLQFEGSALEGFSGGPLVLSEFPEIAIFGIGVLGGEYSSHSRATSSDLIINWLENQKKDHKLKNLVFQTIPFEEVLKRIVFGNSDWTQVVKDQWFSKWDYARNPDGEYVSAISQGTQPVMIAGSAVRIFDSNTEEVIRSQGISTGSTLYAELFEKHPSRFGQNGDDS